MAAVFALIMLPLIAAIGFFVGANHIGGSLSVAFAGAVFVALSIGVFGGALRLAREAEGPESHS